MSRVLRSSKQKETLNNFQTSWQIVFPSSVENVELQLFWSCLCLEYSIATKETNQFVEETKQENKWIFQFPKTQIVVQLQWNSLADVWFTPETRRLQLETQLPLLTQLFARVANYSDKVWQLQFSIPSTLEPFARKWINETIMGCDSEKVLDTASTSPNSCCVLWCSECHKKLCVPEEVYAWTTRHIPIRNLFGRSLYLRLCFFCCNESCREKVRTWKKSVDLVDWFHQEKRQFYKALCQHWIQLFYAEVQHSLLSPTLIEKANLMLQTFEKDDEWKETKELKRSLRETFFITTKTTYPLLYHPLFTWVSFKNFSFD